MGPPIPHLQHVVSDLSPPHVVFPQREYVYNQDDDLRIFVNAYSRSSTVLEIANYLYC